MAGAGTAILAFDDAAQETLSRVALLSAGWSVRVLRGEETDLAAVVALAPASGRGAMVVIEPRRAVRLGLRIDAALRLLRARLPATKLVVALPDRERPSALATRWAKECGAQGVVGRICRHRLLATAAPLLALSGSAWRQERVEHYATALLGRREDAQPDDTSTAIEAVEALGADLDDLADRLANGAVPAEDRRWRTQVYPQCFVGDAATSWLASNLGVARPAAERIGAALQARGDLYHVVGEQPFRDGHFFYRSGVPSARCQEIQFASLVAALTGPTGPEVVDRTWRGMAFPRCFLGSDAAAAMQSVYRLDFAQAVVLCRALLELHVFRHVADEHDFFGTGLFYRFCHDAAPR